MKEAAPVEQPTYVKETITSGGAKVKGGEAEWRTRRRGGPEVRDTKTRDRGGAYLPTRIGYGLIGMPPLHFLGAIGFKMAKCKW
jgi:hypothetical protein